MCVCTYPETDPSHHANTLQLLLVLLRYHILIDRIQPHGALVIVPPEHEIQDGDLICGGEHDIKIYLQSGMEIGADKGFLWFRHISRTVFLIGN